MARAIGSYPIGRWFKSSCRYHGAAKLRSWLVGQAVKTPAFHAGNTGSSPVRVTKVEKLLIWELFDFVDILCN